MCGRVWERELKASEGEQIKVAAFFPTEKDFFYTHTVHFQCGIKGNHNLPAVLSMDD